MLIYKTQSANDSEVHICRKWKKENMGMITKMLREQNCAVRLDKDDKNVIRTQIHWVVDLCVLKVKLTGRLPVNKLGRAIEQCSTLKRVYICPSKGKD